MSMGIGDRKAQHAFARTPAVNMARSVFDRSFNVKDTTYFDDLSPIFLDEILPGDTCNVNLHAFVRLATQLVPIMDNIYLDFFFFFVPNRLVWTNWERFCGAQDDPGDSISYTIPTVSITQLTQAAGLYEKMGIPLYAGTQVVNSLPFRAYTLIWNQWFRDQDIQNSVVVPIDDGPDDVSDFTMLGRNKPHDYFTSCRPWPQKGTALTIPTAATAPVVTNNSIPTFTSASLTNAPLSSDTYAAGNKAYFSQGSGPAAGEQVKFGNQSGLQVTASGIGGTINELRQAFQVQSLLELDARGGTRYVEILLAHFSVVSPDFRLQRAEYLGGGTININSHVVPQTSATSGSNYRGDLSAFATGASSGGAIGFTKSFTEHGYVIGLINARADITYQQGVNKLFTRSTRYDFFWPKLQEIGEQAVLKRELKAEGDASDAEVFGYQERYAEYRYKPSEIHGYYRSNYATPIDQWHLAQEFSSTPALNEAFIAADCPITRALANVDAPHLLCDFFFNYKHTRPMATYSVPASLGRF